MIRKPEERGVNTKGKDDKTTITGVRALRERLKKIRTVKTQDPRPKDLDTSCHKYCFFLRASLSPDGEILAKRQLQASE